MMIFGMVGMAQATPVLFESNYYEFVQVPNPFTGTNNSWASANANAAASIYNGLSGHLATITSQAENDFLLSLGSGSFSEYTGVWLGGKADEGWLVGPETGQGFTYTNWGGVEPNNPGYAFMNIGATGYSVVSGQWADSTSYGVSDPSLGTPIVGYFTEFEGAANPVPEPTTVLLLGTGLICLARVHRKMKNNCFPR